MSEPTKPLDPYTLRWLARQMREEARTYEGSKASCSICAEGRLIAWASECERRARKERRRRKT